MQLPMQITFRNLDRSEAVESRLRERAAKLDKYYNHIMACRVAVEARHKHRLHGNHYHVRIDVTVPDGELVANHEPDAHHAYTDVYVAIRDAFDSITRQLESYASRRRREVKTHVPVLHGRVVELHPGDGWGRIESPDGRLIYFHRNSVLETGFDRLAIGSEVRFDEELGENGPQASTVHPASRQPVGG